MSAEDNRVVGAASLAAAAAPERYHHLDGTLCVAGHFASSLLCVEGGGPVTRTEGKPDMAPKASRALVEVRTCGACHQPVIYWAGNFMHLTARCGESR